MNNQELAQRRSLAIARGVGVVTSIFADHAENARLWDVEGNEYIDFSSGIAVLNTGHRHPKIIEAVSRQLEAFSHTSHQVIGYESYLRLAERLNELVPSGAKNKTVFVTSGVEAVENAIKIARSATGRSIVVAFSGAFHGRTMLGMSLTGKVVPYKAGFGPLIGGVYHVPFPVELHGITTEHSLGALECLFRSDVAPEDVAAIIIEPVQGEGGFYIAPGELISGLREICDRHNIVFIADEVQTGFGRTGKLFAMENYDASADITAMAKGMAGGFPIAGLTGRAELMDAPVAGGLGSTYGGNPLAVAAANAVLDVIEQEGLCERANVLGLRLKQRLESIRVKIPGIVDIRGLGFMCAVEFNDPQTGKPDPDFTNRLRVKALANGLVLLSCGIYGNVIRFLAPLTIEDDLMSKAMDILERSIDQVAAN